MRTYLNEHIIPTFVASVDGNVTVRLTPDAFYVCTERFEGETRYLPRIR